jgi:Na+-translocating ferredoxin:NAD+ oxidoreductase RnfA subunit
LLDAIFWCIWLLAPFLIWQSFDAIWARPYSYEEFGDMQSPIVATFSMQGKLLVGLASGLEMVQDVATLVLMHRLVRQFKRGDMLIAATLRTMKYIAWIAIAMSIIEILVYNLNSYWLYRLGDVPTWQPLYTINLMILAVGIFLLALKMLIEHAIALQKDVDLTV